MRSTIAGLLLALTVWPAWSADIRVDFQTVAPKGPGEVAALEPGLGRTRIVRIDPRSLSSLRQAKRGDTIVIPVPGGSTLSMNVEQVGPTATGKIEIRGTCDRDYKGKSYVIINKKSIGGIIYAQSKIYDLSSPRGTDTIVINEREWSEGETEGDASRIEPYPRRITASKGTPLITDIKVEKYYTPRKESESDYKEIGVIILITKSAYDANENIVEKAYIELDDASYALFQSGIYANFVVSAIGKLNLYDESGESFATTLGKIPKYPTLDDYRNERRGDIVVVYRMKSKQKECGLANYVYKSSK